MSLDKIEDDLSSPSVNDNENLLDNFTSTINDKESILKNYNYTVNKIMKSTTNRVTFDFTGVHEQKK
jgi:hypothetical protein